MIVLRMHLLIGSDEPIDPYVDHLQERHHPQQNHGCQKEGSAAPGHKDPGLVHPIAVLKKVVTRLDTGHRESNGRPSPALQRVFRDIDGKERNHVGPQV
eukprot:CAMPEP_0168255044 /NCGR_PEP_ID=MMETSP0141_2-20121125/5064_1 /TAXON_ID=44445 /ORGANISM="Pseudo-nitzschia australis, Strain 10249 10 AB" /LENGTH=98 /DNA_ID=CAMNT_0008191557 /DNA_START=1241 /DNA_END=1537 /DNA_ORIENTATION=-